MSGDTTIEAGYMKSMDLSDIIPGLRIEVPTAKAPLDVLEAMFHMEHGNLMAAVSHARIRAWLIGTVLSLAKKKVKAEGEMSWEYALQTKFGGLNHNTDNQWRKIADGYPTPKMVCKYDTIGKALAALKKPTKLEYHPSYKPKTLAATTKAKHKAKMKELMPVHAAAMDQMAESEAEAGSADVTLPVQASSISETLQEQQEHKQEQPNVEYWAKMLYKAGQDHPDKRLGENPDAMKILGQLKP